MPSNCLNRFSVSISSVILCAGTLVADEGIYGFPSVQWIGNKVLLREFAAPAELLDLSNKTKQIRLVGNEVDLEAQVAKQGTDNLTSLKIQQPVFYVNGSYYHIEHTNRDEGDGKVAKVAIAKKLKGKTWEVAAEYSYLGKGKPFLVPLENGKWLVLDAFPNHDVSGKREDAIFSIMSVDKNKTLDKKGKNPIDSGLGKLIDNERVLRIINGNNPVLITDDYLIFGAYRFGFFWSFSLKNGSSTGLKRLYDEIKDEMIEKGQLSRPVINAQPTPDGTVYIAARPWDAILKDSKEESERNKRISNIVDAHKGNMSEAHLLYDRIHDERYAQHPIVKWFEYHPKNGMIKALNPSPVGARDTIQSMAEFRNFFWIVDETETIQYLKRGEFKLQERNESKPGKVEDKKIKSKKSI